MSKKSSAKITDISKAKTLEEIADFWDTHSLADYWNQTKEAEFEIRAMKRRRITIDPEIYSKIEFKARTRGILPETLINMWLSDRLHDSI